jgi:deoxyribonucleoside regulator
MDNGYLVKVAYMYYVQNISQKDIAIRINTSRTNVARLLRLCREKGIVEFKINDISSYEIFLAMDIKEKYNLNDVTVISDALNKEDSMFMIGKTGASIVDKLITDNSSIGISLGTTLYHFVSKVTPSNYQNVDVVQLVGASQTRSFKTDGINLVETMASKLGATGYLIHSPFLVKNENMRKMLIAEPEVNETLKKMNQINLAVIGIGSNQHEIMALQQRGFLDDTDENNIVSPDAVCTICGQQLDKDGKLIDCSLNKRVLAISVDDLKNTQTVLALAGGKNKVEAIKAALKGGFIDILVTDKEAALGLLVDK